MENTRADLSCKQEEIVNAGGAINSFYDVYEQKTEEEMQRRCKRLIGMPLAEDYEELIGNLK